MIRQIEEFSAKLRIDPFRDFGVFDERYIEDDIAGAEEQVARRVSERKRSGNGVADGSNQRVILRSSRDRLPTLVTSARLLRHPWTLDVKLTENGCPVRKYVIPATLHPPTILFANPPALENSALP